MSKEMTQQLIGKVLTEEAGRDAIHIAVAPTEAKVKLYPGQDVGVDGSTLNPLVGIVDPFLKEPVFPGQRFFIFLYPNTITGLRHEWTHPAYTGQPEPLTIAHETHQQKSEAWLKDFAANTLDIGYHGLMSAAGQWVQFQEHTVQRGAENWRDNFSGHERDFWHHYEIVTGSKVEDPEAHFFCCTC